MIKGRILSALTAALISSSILFSCSDDNESQGTLSLSLTDAPTDAEDIAGVYVTITGVEYRAEGESWQPLENFGEPYKVNLLDLTNGETALLGDFSVEAGNYDGLRFILDAAENGGSVNNPATYLEFTDGRQVPLFVPSGTQSGYKAKGTFSVPVNGTVFITADFDVRKSVVEAGASGKYLLKPTIRLVVNEQAGTISGTVGELEEGKRYVVYAYEKDAYTEAEAAEPAEGEARFPTAVSSTVIASDTKSFELHFLAAGEYQLVIAAYANDLFEEVVYVSEELLLVESEKVVTVDITL
ncbi:DUF4382 domain-containing protein [Nafulsella turpanensis]|uniref:DUF4382 domain-containing protein n=1 Tax=Nafulsella turpanensis TaxID=1265690 RepID=UPI0003486FC4|nr:DUF4382 domain-containing protein [Nafulsella turpanensis]